MNKEQGIEHKVKSSHNQRHREAAWPSGRVVRAPDLKSGGRGFISR